MPRKRMIYAELFEDEHFNSLTDKAKILFIACLVNADDDGRLIAHSANLRAYAFRYEELSVKKIESLIIEIVEKMKNFRYYKINDSKYIEFSKWKEYQHIRLDRYKSSNLPAWQPNDNQIATIGMLKLNEVKVSKDNIREEPPLLSFMEEWNNFTGHCLKLGYKVPKIQSLTESRKEKLKKRLLDKNFTEALEGYKIFNAIISQPFLLGNNDRGWVLDFDWLLENDTNFIKVMERKYQKDK